MSPALIGVIPDNFHLWRMESLTLNGRLVCTARRTGITLQLIRDPDGWWTVTKMRGGKVLTRKQVKDMPARIVRMIEGARPRRHRIARESAPRPA